MSVSTRIEGVLFIRDWGNGTGQATFWCPGCDEGHTIQFGGAEAWTWNGDAARPTFSPSVLALPRQTLNEAGRALLKRARKTDTTPELTDEHRTWTPRCHSFVRAGRIEYLGDCGHDLAGQTVDMVPLPKRYAKLVRR